MCPCRTSSSNARLIGGSESACVAVLTHVSCDSHGLLPSEQAAVHPRVCFPVCILALLGLLTPSLCDAPVQAPAQEACNYSVKEHCPHPTLWLSAAWTFAGSGEELANSGYGRPVETTPASAPHALLRFVLSMQNPQHRPIYS